MKHFCIYKFINTENEIIYIGKTCSVNPQLRFNYHATQGHLPKECYDKTFRIEIVELTSEADIMIYEPYLINLYKPLYNIEFKTNDKTSLILPDLRWIDKEEYINSLKTDYDNSKRKKNSYPFKFIELVKTLKKGTYKKKDICIELGMQDSKHFSDKVYKDDAKEFIKKYSNNIIIKGQDIIIIKNFN